MFKKVTQWRFMLGQKFVEILREVVKNYSRRDELKEICISLCETGQLTIGGRRMLISEMHDKQSYEETIGCIKVIFASSSDNHLADEAREDVILVDELRELLINDKSRKVVQNYFTTLSIEHLALIAPKLECISFKNWWKNA